VRRPLQFPAAAVLIAMAMAGAISTSQVSATTARLLPPLACAGCWRPALHTTWQWQLSSRLDTRVKAAMYDIDMFASTKSQVASLHRLGRKVVCYIDAGSWENWRPDAGKFPKSVLGKKLQGWPGERWLDIRRVGILGPLMRRRVQQCKSKRFDGVEFDNVDGYENESGFPLKGSDQLRYNVFLANLAHADGLSAALKNDTDQVGALLPYFDWSLDEQCFEYQECAKLLPFINAGKPVFEVEYSLQRSRFCPRAKALGFNAMRKHLDLGAWLQRC
jgi:hypothetical protein